MFLFDESAVILHFFEKTKNTCIFDKNKKNSTKRKKNV